MKKSIKKIFACVLSMALAFSGVNVSYHNTKAAETNVANGKNSTTYLTSNANNGNEGFLYVGNGFSAINVCNENYGNGNNLLGKTATTDEVAVLVDLQGSYNLSSVKLYQGSTNASFNDSYCKSFKVYYSTEQVTKDNKGEIQWKLAGSCDNGTIYNGSGIKINTAEDVSGSGDTVTFDETAQKAKSVKVVFDKEQCMGTGNTSGSGTLGTVSLVSLQVYGEQDEETTDESQKETLTTTSTSDTNKSDDGATDILFIGNSMTYYNTLCNVVQELAKYYGHNIKCSAATNGGQTLIGNAKYDNVLSAIKQGGHDIVILQDIVGSFDGDNLMTGVDTLKGIIKQYNPDAKLMLYMPWPVKEKLTGENSKEPYFVQNYIKAARTSNATLAPAGEAFYQAYENGYDYYVADNKHPMPLGTFVSATSIFYALYPEETVKNFNETDQTKLSEIINNNIAYSNAQKTTYDLEQLNFISNASYNVSHNVIAAVADKTGKTKYESVAGSYTDPDEGIDTSEAIETMGETVDNSAFTKSNGNIAIGCTSKASSGTANLAFDGNTGTRWESEKSDPQWLYVDLGEEKEIDKVGFVWEGAYASKYYIQLSDNGEDWKTVAVVRASDVKTVAIDLGKTYKTRYVKMLGTKRGTIYGYSIWEMAVWEHVNSEPDTTKDNTTTKETNETEDNTTTKETNVTEDNTTTKETGTTTSEESKTTTVEESKTTTVEETTTEKETTTVPEVTTTKKDDVPETTENVTTGNKTNASTTAKKALKKTKITKKSKKKLASKKIKLTFKKVTGAKKYVVQVSTSKKFKKVLYKKVVRKTKATLSSKKIKNKKKLYVRVKAVGASKWSKPARIKIKK